MPNNLIKCTPWTLLPWLNTDSLEWNGAPSQRHLACHSAPHLPFWKVG